MIYFFLLKYYKMIKIEIIFPSIEVLLKVLGRLISVEGIKIISDASPNNMLNENVVEEEKPIKLENRGKN